MEFTLGLINIPSYSFSSTLCFCISASTHAPHTSSDLWRLRPLYPLAISFARSHPVPTQPAYPYLSSLCYKIQNSLPMLYTRKDKRKKRRKRGVLLAIRYSLLAVRLVRRVSIYHSREQKKTHLASTWHTWPLTYPATPEARLLIANSGTTCAPAATRPPASRAPCPGCGRRAYSASARRRRRCRLWGDVAGRCSRSCSGATSRRTRWAVLDQHAGVGEKRDGLPLDHEVAAIATVAHAASAVAAGALAIGGWGSHVWVGDGGWRGV